MCIELKELFGVDALSIKSMKWVSECAQVPYICVSLTMNVYICMCLYACALVARSLYELACLCFCAFPCMFLPWEKRTFAEASVSNNEPFVCSLQTVSLSAMGWCQFAFFLLHFNCLFLSLGIEQWTYLVLFGTTTTPHKKLVIYGRIFSFSFGCAGFSSVATIWYGIAAKLMRILCTHTQK